MRVLKVLLLPALSRKKWENPDSNTSQSPSESIVHGIVTVFF